MADPNPQLQAALTRFAAQPGTDRPNDFRLLCAPANASNRALPARFESR